MRDGKRILAVIPARGGSKGVLRKNIRLVSGKPLIAYTIESALGSRFVDAVVVSSEDDEILDVAARHGAQCLRRPENLALDTTPGVAPVLHAIEQLPGFDLVILLQPTSPLRTAMDIDAALEHCVRQGAVSCVAVCEAETPPARMFEMAGDGKLRRLVGEEPPNRRQDLPPAYIVNGAIYIADTEWLVQSQRLVSGDTVGYLMPRDRSLDIDTELDLEWFAFVCNATPDNCSANVN